METKKHPRFSVKWPVKYWSEGLIGQGNVVNICQGGCQIAGTMEVTVGMRLKLSILPPSKDEPLCVEKAEVWWMKSYQLGLNFDTFLRSTIET